VARQRAQLIAAAFQALTLIITVTGCAALPVQATQDGRDTPAAQRGSADSGGPGSATSPTMSAASQSLLQQSRSQQRAGDYPQAAATLERALRVDPSQPVLWLELSAAEISQSSRMHWISFLVRGARKASWRKPTRSRVMHPDGKYEPASLMCLRWLVGVGAAPILHLCRAARLISLQTIRKPPVSSGSTQTAKLAATRRLENIWHLGRLGRDYSFSHLFSCEHWNCRHLAGDWL
jgi:hypothetical protein